MTKIPAMTSAFAAVSAAAPRSAATDAHRLAFHEGVSLLFAAQKARQAGDFTAAKHLAEHSEAVVGTPGASRATVVKRDANSFAFLKAAVAQLPSPAGLTKTPQSWLKEGWEPDFF